MNDDFKTKLVAALRSGKYVQDAGKHHTLRTKTEQGECYCVMGVVADVLDPQGWSGNPDANEHYLFHDNYSACLSPADLLAIGMTADEQWDEFIYPNDRGELTFAQFADRLEAANA